MPVREATDRRTTLLASFLLARARFRWALPLLAIAGVVVCAGQFLVWSVQGAWPLHDSAAFWLSGTHFIEGRNPYAGDVNYLTMLYSPPWVVIMGVLSRVPFEIFEVGLLVGQILALRAIAGSWLVAGLLCWLPFTPRELITGNLDLIIGASILLAVRGGSTSPLVLFAFAKFAPVLALTARGSRWREALVAAVVLLAITVPWLILWPEWVEVMIRAQAQVSTTLPILPRIPLVAVLLWLRRPWSVALAAGLATPGFYFHSAVLLYPGFRLWVDDHSRRTAAPIADGEDPSASASTQLSPA